MSDEHHKDHEKTFTFIVDNVEYKTDKSTLTGAEIKAMIPGFDPSYALFLESPDDKPDEQIKDSTTVELEKGKHPKRFYTVPPANFGTL